MLCEICNKNQATVHLTEIMQNVKKEFHICEECARQKGVVQKVTFSISNLMGKLMDPMVGKTIKEMASLKCPDCGMTYPEFRSKARLGCARDYEVFKTGLVPLIEKIHGATQHCGKIPSATGVSLKKENELIRLKRDLDQVVKAENFEKAAELRDRIRVLETELTRKEK